MQIAQLIIGIGIGLFIASMVFVWVIGTMAKGNKDTEKQRKSDMADLLNHWRVANNNGCRQAEALENIAATLIKK